MSVRDQRVLVEAHMLGPTHAPEFEDGGSNLLATATYVALKHGRLDQSITDALCKAPAAHGHSERSPCCLQIWCPPIDAPEEWYAHQILHRGQTWVFEPGTPPAEFLAQFETQAKPTNNSYGAAIGLPVLDMVAWRRWRTLPDMSRLLDKSQQANRPPT